MVLCGLFYDKYIQRDPGYELDKRRSDEFGFIKKRVDPAKRRADSSIRSVSPEDLIGLRSSGGS
ncbi:MAG: hypothetical protein CMJ40_01705 [Phycisphaerae bacterium]|nr:hypothetical protein [Phycisphaerae bacterium]